MRFAGWSGKHVGEPSLWIDVVELGGLCRLPNYAERSWKQAVVAAHRTDIAQFHSA